MAIASVPVAVDDDGVARFADWLRGAFPDTDQASTIVIATWMTAAFLASTCERLADDLVRLGHVHDGSADLLARVAGRASRLATTLRAPPGVGTRPQITAGQLDGIRRQLRFESATIAQCLATVASGDEHTGRVVSAIVDAATWLAVADLRGAVEELHGAAGVGTHAVSTALEAFHDAVAGTVRPRSTPPKRGPRGRTP